MENHVPIYSDEEILKPTEVLMLDASRYIDCLYQHRIDQYIVEPQKGLWLPWAKEPYLLADTYVIKDDLSGIEITDLNEVVKCNEIVIGKTNKKIYHPDQFKKIKSKLRSTPSYPVELVNLIYAQVRQYVTLLAPVNRRYDTRQIRVSNYIKPEININSELLESIEIALDDLFLAVNEFIDKDCNFLICTRVEGTTIIIEKLVDYRIFDWNRKMREELNPNEDA